MKTSSLLCALIILALLSSCQTDPQKIHVAWAPGYVYVPRCKPLVKYQGTSFEVQGVKIPVPQLGGNAEIGGIKVDPKVLNQAYQTTQLLDASYHQNCELLPSFSTDKDKFEAAVQRMNDSQTKLQQLAFTIIAPVPNAPAVAAAPAPPPGNAPLATAAVANGATAATPPPTAAAQPAVVKKRLGKWVKSYAKKSKKAVVQEPVKANATLDLPSKK